MYSHFISQHDRNVTKNYSVDFFFAISLIFISQLYFIYFTAIIYKKFKKLITVCISSVEGIISFYFENNLVK